MARLLAILKPLEAVWWRECIARLAHAEESQEPAWRENVCRNFLQHVVRKSFWSFVLAGLVDFSRRARWHFQAKSAEKSVEKSVAKSAENPAQSESAWYQRAPNSPEFAQPHLSRVKARSSPARGYKFGCVCSYMAGHEDAGVVTAI